MSHSFPSFSEKGEPFLFIYTSVEYLESSLVSLNAFHWLTV